MRSTLMAKETEDRHKDKRRRAMASSQREEEEVVVVVVAVALGPITDHHTVPTQ